MRFADRVIASDGRRGVLLSKQIDHDTGKAYWIVLEKLHGPCREQITFNAPESHLRFV